MTCPAGFTSSRAPFAATTETLVPGQRFPFWDYDITWTEKHFPASRLEPLRQVGDVLADNALAALNVKPGQDALVALREYTAQPIKEQTSEAPRLLMQQLMTVPEWVNWAQVQRGQEVYWKYVLFISHVLLHFSLAGGFSIPKITKVLNSTGYLSGKRTKERVLETSQFILDVVHSLPSIQPGHGNTGWESIIQVRFLHAGVRARLSKLSRDDHSTKYYNVQEHGVPINQEDLLATLFSFSNTMWRVMETRMDVHMTIQEREDYLHLWRYIGHMMGVDDSFLSATTSPERADAALESIVLHLTDPDESSGRMCASLLHNMASPSRLSHLASRLGLPDPVKVHMALAEHLLGPAFWTINGLPRMTHSYRFLNSLLRNVMRGELWLMTCLPGGWARIRGVVIRESQRWLIARGIGKERTQFELKAVPKDKAFVPYSVEAEGEIQGRERGVWSMWLTAASAALGIAFVLMQRV
ncbi:hypothetical protein MVEG_10627 [Podila verticillata NRRL 6337]|nr:hypothetical protein MVEG_10627 [Podila verticillata NRRL 6337]